MTTDYKYAVFVVLAAAVLLLEQTRAIRVLPSSRRNVNDDNKSHLGLLHRRLLSIREGAYTKWTQRRRRRAKRNVPVDIPDSPDGHLVTSLPLLKDSSFTTKQWAGHLPASPDGDKYFFYWLFEPEIPADFGGDDKSIPLLIWLNGGPGCSSMDGLFLENGPFRMKPSGGGTGEYRLIPDPYSWHKLPAYTLYIDQPVGTGLSFTTSGKYPSNDDLLNRDFYYFLQSFLNFHSDKFVDSSGTGGLLEMQRPLYFSGESYAGHYQGIYVNYILKQNDLLVSGLQTSVGGKVPGVIVKMAGAAIGNGWVDPFYQYAGAEAAYGHGLIGMPEVNAYQEKEKQCQSLINKGHYSESVCYNLIDDLVSQSQGGSSQFTISSYDVRRVENKRGDRLFPPGHKVIDSYLGGWPLRNDPGTLPEGVDIEARRALHATAADTAGQKYQECTDPPYDALSRLDGLGIVPDLIQVLEHPANVQLLFFNGIMDMVCNHVGNERSLEKMQWKHQDDWNQAKRYAWMANNEPPGKVAGYMREFNNLMYLKVLEAGHMVPLDVPNVAFQMMRTFVHTGSFQSSQQRLDRSIAHDESCPICPSCPKQPSGGGVVPPSQYGTGVVVSYPFLVVASGLGIVIMCVVYARRKRRRPVSTSIQPDDYDMELRESRYSDDNPESNGEMT